MCSADPSTSAHRGVGEGSGWRQNICFVARQKFFFLPLKIPGNHFLNRFEPNQIFFRDEPCFFYTPHTHTHPESLRVNGMERSRSLEAGGARNAAGARHIPRPSTGKPLRTKINLRVSILIFLIPPLGFYVHFLILNFFYIFVGFVILYFYVFPSYFLWSRVRVAPHLQQARPYVTKGLPHKRGGGYSVTSSNEV